MSELDKKMNEYHLMIEEVLGGMDLLLSRLEQRVNALEKKETSVVEVNSKLNRNHTEKMTESDFHIFSRTDSLESQVATTTDLTELVLTEGPTKL